MSAMNSYHRAALEAQDRIALDADTIQKVVRPYLMKLAPGADELFDALALAAADPNSGVAGFRYYLGKEMFLKPRFLLSTLPMGAWVADKHIRSCSGSIR